MSEYIDEKNPLVGIKVLPVPATYTVEKKRPSFFGRLLRFVAIFFITFSTLNYLVPATSRYVRHAYGGCHYEMKKTGDHDHQHPFPPVDKWKPYEGTTHFEYKPEEAAGFSVRGTNTFGKVVFETSKVSDKVIIDLDIKTDRKDKHGDVSIEEKDGYLTVKVPSSGDLWVHSAAKISIPSNIIGTFGLDSYDVNLPQHMVDYSGLPESLEIGSLTVRVAKGFVKTGPVKTNSTQISVGHGVVKGSLHQARELTKLDVATGNVTLEVSGISSGNEGRFNAKVANGHLKGSYLVYNSTTLDVVSGTIYANVRFEAADEQHIGELSTKVASGSSRVYVDSIADYRIIESHHDTINGDQVLTYPENFVGTIDARGIAGDIKLAGKDVVVEKVLGGLKGTKGDAERNYIGAKAAKGSIDILIGKDE